MDDKDYFKGIIGQQKPLKVLRKALVTGAIHHAYLFSGPKGIGKKTIAYDFAQAIILNDDPLGEVYVRENIHPDLLIIERDEKKTLISIEQINREMEPWLSLKPYRSSRRVVIINEANLLSLPAANALLKTLEEPPGHAVIMLVADEQLLLETIISRCQLLRFFPLPEADLHGFLIQKKVDYERAAYLARLAQGCLTTAAKLAETEELEQMWRAAWEVISGLATGQEIEVFKSAEEIEKSPEIMTALLTSLLRDIFVYQKTNRKELLIMSEYDIGYEKMKHLDGKRVLASLARIDELRNRYKTSVRANLLSINISYHLMDALQ